MLAALSRKPIAMAGQLGAARRSARKTGYPMTPGGVILKCTPTSPKNVGDVGTSRLQML
jgi:hypothetical protein